ncbi:MAG: beta-N-acetylhexosaminidase [Lysobacterales bacterium]|jgi:beta-N-acetylhexosaminidase
MSGSIKGRILIGLEGSGITDSEKEVLRHEATGGVVLFTRNYIDRQQLKDLCKEIRETAAKPMLITVDHEGGRVQRFREGFTRLPALAVLGRVFKEYPERALDLAYRHGRVMATELLVCGVDMSFAPVLDLNGESCVIGDRAFADDSSTIIELGEHYLAGMHDSGMKTCGKHFPGHGSVEADSHVSDVCDSRPLKAIEAGDIETFRGLVNGLDSVMMAHVVYPEVDDKPAGYSTFWIGEYLRKKLGFEGVVFSDDLGMHAAGFAGKLFDRMQGSFDAGCDAVLVCGPEDVKELYSELVSEDANVESVVDPTNENLLSHLQGKNTHTEAELDSVGEWRHWQQSLELLEKSQWA